MSPVRRAADAASTELGSWHDVVRPRPPGHSRQHQAPGSGEGWYSQPDLPCVCWMQPEPPGLSLLRWGNILKLCRSADRLPRQASHVRLSRYFPGLRKYGWEAHDGQQHGRQELFDERIHLTTSFRKRFCEVTLTGMSRFCTAGARSPCLLALGG